MPSVTRLLHRAATWRRTLRRRARPRRCRPSPRVCSGALVNREESGQMRPELRPLAPACVHPQLAMRHNRSTRSPRIEISIYVRAVPSVGNCMNCRPVFRPSVNQTAAGYRFANVLRAASAADAMLISS